METVTVDAMGEDSPVRQAVLEIEDHVAAAGWDQPPRLFALVRTGDLIAAQPDLTPQLGEPDSLTPIEQDLPPGREVEDLLAEIGWPDEVDGCAVVMERLTLPPQAEADLPQDPAEALRFAAEHPDRQEMRIVAAATRDGGEHAAVRARTPDDAPLLEGPGLLPGLVGLLHDTLEVGSP